MRLLRILPLLLAIAVVWLLNHSFSASVPAFGRLLDPVNGALANAEPLNKNFNQNLRLKGLQAPAQIWLDTALVAHIRADNDHDLYYAQGYLHAYFRLWQMDLQTRAAWGRVSEVAGPKAVNFDRGMRREGMVWAAQHSLDAMETDPRTKLMLDAYRDGVNAYIGSLHFRSLPLEYKLMGFAPEAWTNLRTALLMKYMARDLTGKTDDIANTILRDQLGQEQFDFLFPGRIKNSQPVIPEGTKFEAPSLPQPKVPEGDVWAHFKRESNRESTGVNRESAPSNTPAIQPSNQSGVGSNNWAVSGRHTVSGKAILCNDPHLGLNLPSLWFEMQLTAPGINCYGASLPGAPGIVIGFNENISWGFTNNYRDVKDFYEIVPTSITFITTSGGIEALGKMIRTGSTKPASETVWERPKSYWFNGKEVPFGKSAERIKVRGAKDFIDTVLYTIHGPVTFDPTFRITSSDATPPGQSLLACTWMAHRGSNELLATYLLNRAGDYASFTDAISHFECPAQNIAYADVRNNIAMWGQGRFINKWKDQGKYVMRGNDSSTLWGASIPMAENPHVLNPPQGYVASANQQVTDSTYPYWYNGDFTEWRSWEINWRLRGMGRLRMSVDGSIDTPKSDIHSMMALQNDTYSRLAGKVSWLFHVAVGKPYDAWIKDWGLHLAPESEVPTRFEMLWARLYKDIWQDELDKRVGKWPSSELTVDMLRSDSTSKYYDDKNTPQAETLREIAQRAFRETEDSLRKLASHQTQASHNPTLQPANPPTRQPSNPLEWYWVKNTTLTHLAKIPAFSYDHLKIGGWSNTINACRGDHGPSWRMIVEMDSMPRAYTIYPGGQSGNPGSRFYSDFIQQWVEGKYHEVQFLAAGTTKNPLKYTWTLSP